MQLCDLNDLYSKFDVIKNLRIGNMEKPRFNYSDGFSLPDSDGDIIYEKSKFDIKDDTNANVTTPRKDTNLSQDNGNQANPTTVKDESQAARSRTPPEGAIHSADGTAGESVSATPEPIAAEGGKDGPEEVNGSFEGPLTKTLKDEDNVLTEDEQYVNNPVTYQVRIFLPNKHLLKIILKRDATVQDAIEKTIRKSNALVAAFDKKYAEIIDELERKKKEEEEKNQPDSKPENCNDQSPPNETETTTTTTPPSTTLPPTAVPAPPSIPAENADSFEVLSDLLSQDSFSSRRSRRPQLVRTSQVESIRTDDIIGAHAMSLLADTMAYELRMEMSDGECDMDFPALERGGILRNFMDSEMQGFCLVSVPDYQPRSTSPVSEDEIRAVRMVFEDQSLTLSVPATTTCRQLLNEARHHLYPGRVYELTVSPEDKERLKMMSVVINENCRLCDIDVTSFRIRIKQFVDGPKRLPLSTNTYSYDNASSNNPPNYYMFTNFEAGKYKEWVVTSFSHNGRRQKQIFAIDRDEVIIVPLARYMCCRSCGAGSQIDIFISDIVNIAPNDVYQNGVSMKYRDDDYDSDDSGAGGNQGIEYYNVLEFTTANPDDRLEIITRIEHLVRNSH